MESVNFVTSFQCQTFFQYTCTWGQPTTVKNRYSAHKNIFKAVKYKPVTTRSHLNCLAVDWIGYKLGQIHDRLAKSGTQLVDMGV